MEDILKQINEFLLSISQDIYLYIVELTLTILTIMVIYDFLKKAGEKFDTTPLGAFFIILTLPITIPIVLLWGIIKAVYWGIIIPVYIFLKPYLSELLFLIIGLFKIIIAVVGGIIQLGKGSASNLEINALTLIGEIEILEDELEKSKAKRKELLDSLAASLGGSFDISNLHGALIILLYTMFENLGFDREVLANLAVKSTLYASAGRIHDLIMNDLLPKEEKSYNEFDDDIPF